MNPSDKKKNSDATRIGRGLTPPRLVLLISVVEREKADLYLTLIQGYEANMQLSMAADGTASRETLSYLGLSQTEKTVIFSVIRENRADAALRELEERFRTVKNGKGIAFTVPMTGVIGVSVYRFLSDSRGLSGVRIPGGAKT